MYLEGVDYFVRVVPLPYGVHGCVSVNEDGTYSIYINALDPLERRLKALRHEKKHIERNDFSKSDVREVERI